MKKYFPESSYNGTKFNFDDKLLKKELLNNAYNFYVYILECSDLSYYVGLTNNLDARLKEHYKGLNPRSYTYTRRPVVLKYFELYHSITDAIARENQIKRWSRDKKIALINSENEDLKRHSKRNSSSEKSI